MTGSGRPAKRERERAKSAGRTAWRVLWVTTKVLIIPVLCVAALIVGMAIGYSVLGKQDASDVFDWKTWQHLYDLVFSDGG